MKRAVSSASQPSLPIRPLERGPNGSHFSPGFVAAWCSQCGSPELIAMAPGSEPVTAPGGIAISTGQPPRQWCRACWPVSRPVPSQGSQP